MIVSSLADGVMLSPNYSAGRIGVTRLTPHHTACIATAEQIAAMFQTRQASCNYAIGYDGRIVCVVPEENRSWCSSSAENDNLAITFEISDCNYDWEISEASLQAYIDLCVDLIKRYPSLGGCYNWTGDFSGNVTLHRWLASTACPADYLASDAVQTRIMNEVNFRLQGRKALPMEFIINPDESGTLFYVSGANITHLDHPDNLHALEKVAELCGVSLPYIELGTKAAPWGFRLFEALGYSDLYHEWID